MKDEGSLNADGYFLGKTFGQPMQAFSELVAEGENQKGRRNRPSLSAVFSPNWKRLINHGRCMLKNTIWQLRHVSFKDWHALRFTSTQKLNFFKRFAFL